MVAYAGDAYYCNGRLFLNLSQAFSIFSKSSSYAVITEGEQNQDLLAKYKSHIYIKAGIEADFKLALLSARTDENIFLCGSSGDGKLDILTQNIVSFVDKTTKSRVFGNE